MQNEKMNRALEIIQAFQVSMPAEKPDFKDPAVLASARMMADALIECGTGFEALASLERETASPEMKPALSNLVHLAIKLARSRAAVLESLPFHASVILPAYGENIRMKRRGTGAGEDPNGENFISEKSKQLQWLFADTQSSYEVLIVDDMSKPDPVSSGQAAAEAIASADIPHFQVLFLEQGVKIEKAGDTLVAHSLRGVEFPKNTRKAGAVYYGAAKAIESYQGEKPHVVVFTDCDLSVDVGQLGNLAKPILDDSAVAVAGSRRLPESILEIAPARNVRSNAARYFRELLLKGLLPKDTQCGAKAFSAEALAAVISSGMEILNFSFDVELLTKISLRFGSGKVVPAAVAWFDSAELTTTDSSVHFGLMKAQLAIAKANKTGSGEIFDKAVCVSEQLTSSEAVWLSFLAKIAADAPLLEKIQGFDPSILPELSKLAA